MQIELKNLKVFKEMTEETNAFHANLYIDGNNVGWAKNDGHGGDTIYNVHADLNGDNMQAAWKVIAAAEEYCKALPPKDMSEYGIHQGGEPFFIPMSLEFFIDEIVENYIQQQAEKKIQKKMATHIMFGNANEYLEVSWGKQFPIEKVLAHPQGKMRIKQAVENMRKQIPDGKILNTNVREEML